MAGGPLATLLAIGAALAVAYIASAIFRKTHVPDILFLLVTGAVLGPVLGLLDVGALREALPLLAALAVITILFDGALEVTPGHLKTFGVPAVGLSFTVLVVTTVACGAIAHFLAGMSWPLALLLGLSLSGAGIAIIVPLARRMSVSSGGMTVILLEAVTSDIFVIVGMFIACTVVASGTFGPALGLDLLLNIGIAGVLGPALGWVWTKFLKRWGTAANSYTATVAVLLLTYAFSETLGGSGPLAVLLFGILVGNARGPDLRGPLRSRLFGEQLIEFHHEIVFFLRAAFFVSMGAVTPWELLAEPAFLGTGFLLAVVVGACRMLGVGLTLGAHHGLGTWDKIATGLLFPRGLVTAAVVIVPGTFGISGADTIVDYAAVVIVLTNLLGTLAVFGASAFRMQRTRRAGPTLSLEA